MTMVTVDASVFDGNANAKRKCKDACGVSQRIAVLVALIKAFVFRASCTSILTYLY